jgi:MerR family transcriptional regulator, light-induced transcriptional regulator
LTLKAVSKRTGIPAATLRTWEHRYRFLRPRRSAAGYRLYGEEEITRIEQVKYLVGQGVRIGAAMKAVIEEAERNQPSAEVQESAGQDSPKENGKHAEVYRLTPRPPRTRPS